jgi:hypothetical protein
LKDKFRVLEIRGGVVVGLTVDTGQSLLEVFEPPNEALEVFVFEEELVLLDQFLSTQLHILIEKVHF